jgi:histidine phosphotransferase ChpT
MGAGAARAAEGQSVTQSVIPTISDRAESSARTALNLAEKMATRLCHDLAGMLGTVSNAMELAAGDPALAAEALDLAQDGARQLGQRLRLLRAAWGGSDAMAERSIGMSELRDLAAGLPLGRRVTLLLDNIPDQRSFTPQAAQLLLNLLMLAVESLHGAGVAQLSGGETGDVVITIDGPRAAWPADLAGLLSDPQAAGPAALQTDRLQQSLLVALLADRAGLRVDMLLAAQTEQAPPLLVTMDG